MNLGLIILSISFIWGLSEVVLAIVKRSQTKDSKEMDKSSLRILWITILTSTFIGVFLGLSGTGFVSLIPHFISTFGIVLILLGLIIRWIAILTLKKYFTVNVAILGNHQIITKGIYGFIRHPAYAGSLFSFIGLGMSFSNWLSTLVVFAPILAAFLYRIRVEEKALIQTFGDEYLNYSKVTKRLIPKIY